MQQIGRYEIRRELGRGNMATVYLAFDPRFQRQVAIKVLPRQFTHDPRYLERFEQEAHTVANLEHTAIVPVHDFGEHNDAPYLVMRYLSGGTLRNRLRGDPMSLDDTIAILVRLAPALNLAHNKGIIHRDLKPSNILFDDEGQAYLSDFGIARLAEASKTMTIIGTPSYMSPEQVRGEESLDGRSDIYALGVILYEMLSGKEPFTAKTPSGQMFAHVTEPVPDILAINRALPDKTQVVIEKAMAKERESRFETALELVVALRNLVDTDPSPTTETAEASDSAAPPKPQAEADVKVESPPPPDESSAKTDADGRPERSAAAGKKIKRSRAIGIDFGTSSSSISVYEADSGAQLIPNRRGEYFTPSVVGFTREGEVVIGAPAFAQAVSNPDRTIFSVKRKLGTDWRVTIDGQEYNATDITAHILRSLKEDAESYLGRPVDQSVMTVPAHFSRDQKQSLRQAAHKADLAVLRIVSEPVATAMAHNTTEELGLVAICDMGGGYFSVAIVEIGDGVYEVWATGGSVSLGGAEFDRRIVKYLIELFKRKNGIDLSSDKAAVVRLYQAAEQAKHALSQLNSVEINVPYIYSDSTGSKHLQHILSRVKFEELVGDLLAQMADVCKNVIEESGYTITDMNKLVLSGLSTKIPLVRQQLANIFSRRPEPAQNPGQSSALGAAVQVGVLEGDVKDILLLDVTSQSLGIETQGQVVTPFIMRNTTIPTLKSQIFTTTADDQKNALIHILEGEGTTIAENRSLGHFIFEGLSQGTGDERRPRLEITFDIDADNVLRVTARDKVSGRSQSMEMPNRDAGDSQPPIRPSTDDPLDIVQLKTDKDKKD